MAADKIINGVSVTALGKAIHEFRHTPGLSGFRFRSTTHWLDGGHSQTTITKFFGAGQENDGRSFSLEADEPPVLLGKDRGPNPVEHLLNALGTCLTGAMVYHSASRGIRIEECECTLEGEIDLKGFLGISSEVRRGYRKIEVTFRVKSDGSPEILDECARFSPVFDVVTHGTEVVLNVEKTGEPLAAGPVQATGVEEPVVSPS
jgi:uncharacterized OsmC-like protein